MQPNVCIRNRLNMERFSLIFPHDRLIFGGGDVLAPRLVVGECFDVLFAVLVGNVLILMILLTLFRKAMAYDYG